MFFNTETCKKISSKYLDSLTDEEKREIAPKLKCLKCEGSVYYVKAFKRADGTKVSSHLRCKHTEACNPIIPKKVDKEIIQLFKYLSDENKCPVISPGSSTKRPKKREQSRIEKFDGYELSTEMLQYITSNWFIYGYIERINYQKTTTSGYAYLHIFSKDKNVQLVFDESLFKKYGVQYTINIMEILKKSIRNKTPLLCMTPGQKKKSYNKGKVDIKIYINNLDFVFINEENLSDIGEKGRVKKKRYNRYNPDGYLEKNS